MPKIRSRCIAIERADSIENPPLATTKQTPCPRVERAFAASYAGVLKNRARPRCNWPTRALNEFAAEGIAESTFRAGATNDGLLIGIRM
jgi:hypothetical protein